MPQGPGQQGAGPRYPKRPAGYFGGGDQGMARRQAYQQQRQMYQGGGQGVSPGGPGVPGGRFPARPAGFFGGGPQGMAQRRAYQVQRDIYRSGGDPGGQRLTPVPIPGGDMPVYLGGSPNFDEQTGQYRPGYRPPVKGQVLGSGQGTGGQMQLGGGQWSPQQMAMLRMMMGGWM